MLIVNQNMQIAQNIKLKVTYSLYLNYYPIMEQLSNFQSISSFSEDVYKIDKMKHIFATKYLMKGLWLLVISLNEKGYNKKLLNCFVK